jgi:hypothetical protein
MADNQERGLDTLLNKLPPEDARQFVEVTQNIIVGAIKAHVPDLAAVFDSVRETLGHTDAEMAEVEEITSKTGDTREDALLKALLLYEAALEAKRNGQRLVLVGSDYRFIREFVGLDRADQQPVQSGLNAR